MNIVKGNKTFNATLGGNSYNFWGILQSGNWEPHTFRVFDKYLDSGHSYVDVGAWVGPTVLYGCQIAKHCWAIEPDRVALDMLAKNMAENDFKNISVYEGAISDHTGDVRLGAVTLGESMTSFLFPDNSFVSPCMTLEDYFAANSIQDCNFIKMDIEGGELVVLPQAVSFLQKLKVPLYLAVHYQFLDGVQLGVVADTLHPFRMELENGTKVSPDDIQAGRVGEVLVFF